MLLAGLGARWRSSSEAVQVCLVSLRKLMVQADQLLGYLGGRQLCSAPLGAAPSRVVQPSILSLLASMQIGHLPSAG